MTDDHQPPAFEALLAGTLALMTGYAQAMQADLDPGVRLAMSRRIAEHLARLCRRHEASPGLRTVLGRLAGCWSDVTCCTAHSRPPAATVADPPAPARTLH
jgi:hypothetical protein